MKPGKTGMTRLIFAGMYSIKGLKAAWKNEAAFRQELLTTIPLAIVALNLAIPATQQILLIFSLTFVMIVELINSAIESAIDRISDDFHELSGRAKDMGSAAVLFAIFFAMFTWVWVLL